MKVSERSSARERLADAIGVRDAAAARASQVEAALVDFDKKLEVTISNFYRADRALEEARAFLEDMLRQSAGDEAGAIAAAIELGAAPPREAYAQAQREFEVATERRRLGSEGRISLEAQLLVAGDALARGERAVDAAVNAVFEEDVLPEMIERAEALQQELVGVRSAILLLADNVDGAFINTGSSTNDLGRRVRSFLSEERLPGITRLEGYRNDPSWQTWNAARVALGRDADAALPVT